MFFFYLTFVICIANAITNVRIADEERFAVLQKLCKLYAEANESEDQ